MCWRCGVSAAGGHTGSGSQLGVARSTVYAILCRAECSSLCDTDRPTRQVVRYQRQRAGELVHVDVKRLACIPGGGGHRMLGRQAGRANQLRQGRHTDFVHACVDDRTRLAYLEAHLDERADTCAGFVTRAAAFFARHGVRIEEVMTDRAFACCRSAAFRAALTQVGARHLMILPPYWCQKEVSLAMTGDIKPVGSVVMPIRIGGVAMPTTLADLPSAPPGEELHSLPGSPPLSPSFPRIRCE